MMATKRTSPALKAMSCPVRVVPISWPSMTPMACSSDSRLALMRPSMVTMSRLLLCSSAVAIAPKAAPLRGRFVALSSHTCSRVPASCSIPWLRSLTPKRNSASPPATNRIVITATCTSRWCQLMRYPGNRRDRDPRRSLLHVLSKGLAGAPRLLLRPIGTCTEQALKGPSI